MSDLGWLRHAARRHPYVVDALIPAVLVLIALTGGQRLRAVDAALAAGLSLPLVWRRRYPVAVFGAVAAVAFVQWLVNIQLFVDVTLLVAFYTVAAYRPWRLVVVAAAVLELGVLLASARWSVRPVESFIFLTMFVVAAGVLGVNMRTRRAYLASLEERAVRLEAERDQQARLAVAAERARISREMHDVVAHSLSVMVALADGAAFATRTAPQRAAEAMAGVSATGRTALAEIRRVLGLLRTAEEPQLLADEPQLRPQPGVGQLDELVGQVRAAGLPVTLAMEGDPSTVPAGAQLAVYRLVQEALTNTLKHGGPDATAAVRLCFAPSYVDIEVVDTGSGNGAVHADGHGIAGMRERAAVYGGQVAAGPAPAGGWRVHVRLNVDGVP